MTVVRRLRPSLIALAERGLLPDGLIRLGIRRIIAARFREINALESASAIDAFMQANRIEPIAVHMDVVNDQHYEAPSLFFKKVLGPRLKYSCCYWHDDCETLEQAESSALRLTCEHAELVDGMNILELGCGWGSLSLWMAEQYPSSRITAVSNSHSQREFIQQIASKRSLANLHIVTADINEFQPGECFDRIVSVEMFEHMRNHTWLMQRVHDWLKPSGRLLVHIFCHRSTPYLYQSEGEQNWMGRHFFSGGTMLSFGLLPKCAGSLRLVDDWRWSGRHYAKTCRAWLNRLDDASHDITNILHGAYGGSSLLWQQRWRMFFMACEELFAFNHGEEWFVAHYLFEKDATT